MTRVVKIDKTGDPEVLKLETINLEKPTPEEVTIEHKAIGLNFIDTYHRSGIYPIELPSGIGVEASGIIKEIGSKVENFSVGDKVAYAGAPLGAYSSERNYSTKNLIKIPDGISCEVAATLMTKGLTAYYLLSKTYAISSNEILLFHAAAGGVGQIFCQWAKSLGCKVIGTVGSEEKIILAKKNGCDFIINYSKDDFAKKVLEFTKGKGVPVVYDGVGKNTFHKSIECLKTRGMMISFGNASGSLENIDVKKSIQPKGLYFTRPSMWHYLSTRDEIKEGADKLFEKIKLGKIKIEIFKKYRLDDVVQAHKDLESRKITGPAIIIP
jgi:NADPH2:quinone reductase